MERSESPSVCDVQCPSAARLFCCHRETRGWGPAISIIDADKKPTTRFKKRRGPIGGHMRSLRLATGNPARLIHASVDVAPLAQSNRWLHGPQPFTRHRRRNLIIIDEFTLPQLRWLILRRLFRLVAGLSESSHYLICCQPVGLTVWIYLHHAESTVMSLLLQSLHALLTWES